MSTFDQRGQRVNYQYNYNIEGKINFEAAQNIADIVSELRKLEAEVRKAAKKGAIGQEAAIDAEAKIRKAIVQAEKPKPNKKTTLELLNEAKTLLEGFTSAAGLVSALVQAAEMVRKLLL